MQRYSAQLTFIAICILLFANLTTAQEIKVLNNLNIRQLKSNIEKASDNGLMPVDAKVFFKGSRPTFSLSLARAEPGKIWVAQTELSDDQFWEQHEKARQASLRLICHREYAVKKKNLHVCIWLFDDTYGPKPDYGSYPDKSQPKLPRMKKIWDSASEIPVTGTVSPAFAKVDTALVDMVRTNQFPGVTIAASYKGKIIYQRGVGYSNLDALVTMKPDQPIRMFQCTRPITSAAIMKLVEQKKLKTTTPVFDFLEIELAADADRNLKKITVHHLLDDSAGFDRKKPSFDPISNPELVGRAINNRNAPVSDKQIIDYMITQSLIFEPGKDRRESNFGFFLLGKVIEKASGVSYETFVQQQFLKPLKLDSISMGKSHLDERPRNEVTYYSHSNWHDPLRFDKRDFGKWVLAPNRHNMKQIGAAGGWISTPTDLLKFASAVREKRSRILSPASVNATLTPSSYSIAKAKGKKSSLYFGLGWYPTNHVRTRMIGGNAGAVTMLFYYTDGLGWAISTNVATNADSNHAANVFADCKIDDKILEATQRLRN